MAEQGQGPVVAAVDFKDWWFIVWARPGRLAWPTACACCLASPPDNKVFTIKERTLIYPLCASCARHGLIDQYAVMICLAIGIVLPAIGYYNIMGPRWFKSGGLNYLAWLLYAISVLGIAGILYWPVTKLTPGKTDRCADNSWPLEEEVDPEDDPIDPKTERTDERQMRMLARSVVQTHGSGLWCLRFTNRKFVEEFLKANGADPASMARVEAAM